MVINIYQTYIILITLTNFVPFVTSQYKCEGSNYTTNGTFRTNLNTLLSSLPATIPDSGFRNASAGTRPDTVSAIALCRGDVQLDTCRSCIRNATVDILNFCPTQNQAYLWRELCMLRYSNESIFGTLSNYPSFWAWNWENATRAEEFKAEVQKLLDDLRVRAASGGAVKKVAAGNRTGPDFQTIYALVQCTPDLSPLDCSTCLDGAAQDLPKCCDWRRVGAIFRPSCNVHYETTEFYNRSMFQEQVLPPLPPPQGKDHDGNSTRIVTLIVVPISCGCVAIAIGVCTFLRRRRTKPQLHDPEFCSTSESLQYDFNKIREATNDFSEANKLGQGGFGIVYKGELINGREIAVKRLTKRLEQGDVEFKNEVLLVARLQHRNLVRLLGFCLKETERILVYEFVQNSSLDHFIFDPIRRQLMDWDTRYNIIKGIAKGLVYLHEDSHLKIIHRDLKLSNVLLDEDMNAKIADFGLARLVMQDKTHDTTSRVAGTYGYMPPEYAFQGHFSIKSDVFGFGVMALEIISGQKNSSFRDEHQNIVHLLSYAWRNWQDGRCKNVIDSALTDDIGFPDEMLRCIHIGLLCVQENAIDRPTMGSALQMLNGSSQIMSTPSKPGFFMQGRLDGDFSNSRELQPSGESTPALSRNDISMSLLYPR